MRSHRPCLKKSGAAPWCTPQLRQLMSREQRERRQEFRISPHQSRGRPSSRERCWAATAGSSAPLDYPSCVLVPSPHKPECRTSLRTHLKIRHNSSDLLLYSTLGLQVGFSTRKISH